MRSFELNLGSFLQAALSSLFFITILVSRVDVSAEGISKQQVSEGATRKLAKAHLDDKQVELATELMSDAELFAFMLELSLEASDEEFELLLESEGDLTTEDSWF